jgi:hypothetical protein
VSGCCSMTSQSIFSYTMARTEWYFGALIEVYTAYNSLSDTMVTMPSTGVVVRRYDSLSRSKSQNIKVFYMRLLYQWPRTIVIFWFDIDYICVVVDQRPHLDINSSWSLIQESHVEYFYILRYNGQRRARYDHFRGRMVNVVLVMTGSEMQWSAECSLCPSQR